MKAWAEPAGAKWRVRGFVNGKRTTLRGGVTSRAEAERFARVVSLEGSDAFADPHALTLASWGDTWLARRELDGIAGIRQERSVWARHVAASALALLPLDAISAPHVVDWLDGVRRTRKTRTIRRRTGVELVELDEPISAQTAQHALRLLSGAFDDAVTRGIIHANPAAPVSLPRQRTTSRSQTDPDEDETWTFLDADEIARLDALPDRRRALFVTAVYTGLRLGELLALRWADVDFERGRVRVRRSKNGKPRTVPLLDPARAALELARSIRTARQHDSALVFCREDGAAYAEGYDGRWGDTWRAKVTDRAVRFHDLRHTCASHLVLGTWGRHLRLDEVKAWLGHGSILVTQRYAHLGEGHLDELARTMRSEASLVASQEASQNDRESAFSRGKGDLSVGLLSRRSNVRIVPGAPRDSREPVGKVWEAAQQVLAAAAEGRRPDRSDEETLALGVLSDPVYVLAQQVLGGGAHASVRAVELAAVVAVGGADVDADREVG